MLRAASMQAARAASTLPAPTRVLVFLSKATKWLVILLLLASVGLMAIVTIGGWDALEGAKAVLIAYMAIYLILDMHGPFDGPIQLSSAPLQRALAELER